INESRKRWKIRFDTPEKWRESVRGYYRLITGVDDAIGQLMTKLEEIGEADNTVIILMGDHGFYLGEHGLAGTWYPHQESLKIPLAIYDPRLDKEKRGKRDDRYAFNIVCVTR
ncbi:MAG: sulfatase-like hydrolase/transferase, partial [Bacteroidota bacterium]